MTTIKSILGWLFGYVDIDAVKRSVAIFILVHVVVATVLYSFWMLRLVVAIFLRITA